MDHPLHFDDATAQRLRAVADQYPAVADLVEVLTAHPETYSRKNAVLAAFRKTLRESRGPDVDREALVTALEAILDALHIESSDGLLNEWLHGISL